MPHRASGPSRNQCASGHTTTAGSQGFGPSLAGVVGRPAGSVAGFNAEHPQNVIGYLATLKPWSGRPSFDRGGTGQIG